MILLMQRPSSILITCPYHRILASRTLSVIHATPSTSLISSFLFLSRNDTSSIHRSILISAHSNIGKGRDESATMDTRSIHYYLVLPLFSSVSRLLHLTSSLA